MYVIADIGSNWFTKQDCLDGIIGAKRAGADCVKFQLFDHRALYGFDFIDENIDKVSLPKEWIKPLARYAKSVDIDFMCSAFSAELLAFVDPYVHQHKVASSDLNNVELLKAIAKTGKPVILSYGGHDLDDIKFALEFFNEYHPSEITLLYCVSEYPSYTHDIDIMLDTVNKLNVGYNFGYSDHSKDLFCAPMYAEYLCASTLEKHLTCLKTPKITPDKRHSLTEIQFKKMVSKIKTGKIIGADELDMRHKHRRMCVATKFIKKDDELVYGYNYGYYRCKTKVDEPIYPIDADELAGKIAGYSIDIGEAITRECYYGNTSEDKASL